MGRGTTVLIMRGYSAPLPMAGSAGSTVTYSEPYGEGCCCPGCCIASKFQVICGHTLSCWLMETLHRTQIRWHHVWNERLDFA